MSDPKPHLKDLNRQDLLTGLSEDQLKEKAYLLHLGELCAAGLATQGSVHFFMHEDGTVRIANPLHVYVDVKALEEDGRIPKFRWVRPVLGANKPQYVAWREGQLWEIEITKEQSAKGRPE